MENDLNSILIEGAMLRDPQICVTPKGTPACTFSLASNRFFKLESWIGKEVSFFDVETWGVLAEACGKKGKKGRRVRVVGRLKQNSRNGSEPRSSIVIVAEHVEFRFESKKENAEEMLAEFTEEKVMETKETVTAFIEFDMPDSCGACPLACAYTGADENEKLVCSFLGAEVTLNTGGRRKDCPLRAR